MDLFLKNRVVLISGGARGIGAATAKAFAAEGAKVALVDRDETAAKDFAATLPEGFAVGADLTHTDSCAKSVAKVIHHFGRLDILVNNAGTNDKVALSAPPSDFLASLERNLLHVFSLTHYARSHLASTRGAIVNVSSKVATTGQGQTSGYAAAKGAMNALTREWAAGLAQEGIRVNTVIPAECDTAQYQNWFASQPNPLLARKRVEDLVPLEHRLTLPEEVADAIVWLASRRASHITGQLLYVDGGYTHLDRALSSSHAW
jgi:L-fucose dehydrogenase